MVTASGRDLRGTRGFTLIELLIVMIIMAILMAIAIPIFLGQRQKAQATKAKAHASIAQKSIEGCAASTVDQTYDGATWDCGAAIPVDEPSLAPFTGNPTCAYSATPGAKKVCATTTATGYQIVATTEDSGDGYVAFHIVKTPTAITKTCTGPATLLQKVCQGGQW